MNRRPSYELLEYEYSDLMNELNELLIDIKTHLFKIEVNRPMPTNIEINEIQSRINEALSRFSKPMRKY